MSSFTIAKEDYVKAAGVVAGIAQAKDMWVYSYTVNRNRTPQDYYNDFCECYEMNALSVQEQYHDAEPDTDSNQYLNTFKKYMVIGKQAAFAPNKLNSMIINLMDFFKSAEYQTEKEAYYFKMKMFFNEILVEMLNKANPHECESWGSFEA